VTASSVSTGALRAITGWAVQVASTPLGCESVRMYTVDDARIAEVGATNDTVSKCLAIGSATVVGDPGTWSIVPEPDDALLAEVKVVAGLGWRRRTRRS
jgi:hypothetical protein